MSQKTQQGQGGRPTINAEDFASDLLRSNLFRHRKLTSFGDVVMEVMKLTTLQKYFVPVMEPLIRRVVKEELQLAMRNQTDNMQRNSDEEMQPAYPRSLQLHFQNTVSQPLFGDALIEAEGDEKIKVALIDSSTGETVTNEPISSAKVEIVVLDGDFNDDAGDGGTREKFNNKIVRSREGKRPLLTGDVVLNLKEGVGFLGDIYITDNSSWIRSGKFRLGARVLYGCNEIRVKEAKTGPFVVKDQRGKADQKHYPPSLSDEVWRLQRIGKKGPYIEKMKREGIKTVKDFLILLYQNPTHLRNILADMGDNMWKVVVKHAKTCPLNERVNVYRPASHVNSGVVFNDVGQVTGLLRDGRYILIDKLSEAEKATACNLATLAFKHWEEVSTLDDETFLHGESSNCAMAGNSDGLKNITLENVGSFDFPNVNHLSNSAMEESSDGMNIITPENDGNFDYPELYASTSDVLPPIFSTGDDNDMDNFGLLDMEFQEDDIHFSTTTGSFQIPGAADESVQDCSMENVEINKANLRWRKIFCVLRWLSVRRIVAKKAMQF
ncbi:Calmodulin-binding protein 60 A like [Heracleum sosnowskyi]|uniref:Calmodulin-binding protein 60 A like n=1 Tax=Heracleum sosnowskyi TaxID=360622 RepID=A0AAD8H3E5_9APIA|nr:Calmodulin-binding protein 60 A like [Heracleum sosnowskyi]